ncbi:protein odr-4 homolog [Adelges cooleyi]|uniref:protein odr-4 homolog n=1 Tax=Adelges cooleyi TaxID=133065 RepID=UPI0021805AE2|nr:protein odr-4 homolog [Adelges cooleyi]XP_050432295.1 protein odr-4 homolog [Adelges cooleyi]XP_050432296.1 protein odr-4 homolog [Adelges cooleyi]
MPGKVFFEKHLEGDLKNLVEDNVYIPGLIIGQVINDDYHVVHLMAITTWDDNKRPSHKPDTLKSTSLNGLSQFSSEIFDRTLDVINFLPGGSYVLGFFIIIPKDLSGIKPVSLDFFQLDNILNEYVLFKDKSETWKYLLLNYSSVNNKSCCYTVDIKIPNDAKSITYKAIDVSFKSMEKEWITFVGTFNFDTLESLNVSGGPKVLSSIRENLLDQLESITEKCVYSFNGQVYDKKTVIKNVKVSSNTDNVLKNVIHIELFREVESGEESKNASLKIVRGKGKIFMSGLCSLAVPFHTSGTIDQAVKAIRQDTIRTFATRLKMHLDSFVEEESEEEDDVANVVHETPRRILILKTDGCRFPFSDYVFPGECPIETLDNAGDILNLPKNKMELYNLLEKGRQTSYDELSDTEDLQKDEKIAGTYDNDTQIVWFIVATLVFAVISLIVKILFI